MRLSYSWFFVFVSCLQGQHFKAFTVAGGLPIDTPVTATNAPIFHLSGLAADATGNVYFWSRYTLFKMDQKGNLIRIAGTAHAGYTGDGGPAIDARIGYPGGIAVAGDGTVYFTDSDRSRIRRVTPVGKIEAVFPTLGFGRGIAIGPDGTLYLSDSIGVVKVSTGGTQTRLLGNGAGGLAGDGFVSAIALDPNGNLYVARPPRIIKIAADGVAKVVAGDGSLDPSPAGIPAANSRVGYPRSVAVDSSGNCFIGEDNYVYKLSGDSILSTWAGSSNSGPLGDGGPALNAQIGYMEGMTADSSGNIYVADGSYNRIRKISRSGTITTAVGDGFLGSLGDGGPAVAAQLAFVPDVALDAAGNLFIADYLHHRIRKMQTDGTITTVAGTGETGYSGDGGSAIKAKIGSPAGIAFDRAGNLYLSDGWSVRKVTPEDRISTVAGMYVSGGPNGYGDGGLAVRATFWQTAGIAVDSVGSIFIADYRANRVRRVSTNGIITTVAGNGVSDYCGDGGPATSASVGTPWALAISRSDELYIAAGSAVRKVSRDGIITTALPYGSAPIDAGRTPCIPHNYIATYATNTGMAFDRFGNLYVADGNVIRKLDPAGAVSTIAGTTYGYSGDGGPATAAQLRAYGMAIDRAGNIYVADGNNDTVRLLRIGEDCPAGLMLLPTPPGSVVRGRCGVPVIQ